MPGIRVTMWAIRAMQTELYFDSICLDQFIRGKYQKTKQNGKERKSGKSCEKGLWQKENHSQTINIYLAYLNIKQEKLQSYHLLFTNNIANTNNDLILIIHEYDTCSRPSKSMQLKMTCAVQQCIVLRQFTQTHVVTS